MKKIIVMKVALCLMFLLGGACMPGLIATFTGSRPVKTNAEWTSYMYDTDIKTWGNGAEILTARFTIAKTGSPLALNSASGDYFWMTFDDDLTGLMEFRINVQGIYE